MVKGESTLSTRYRLRKKTDTTATIKPDPKSQKIDRKSEYKSILGQTSHTVGRKKSVVKSSTKVNAIADRNPAPVSEQAKKRAGATIDEFIIRNRSNAHSKRLVTEETSHTTTSKEDSQLKANESATRKHTLDENEDGSKELESDSSRSMKVRKITLETAACMENQSPHDSTQEDPLTPKSQMSDGDTRFEQTDELPKHSISTAKLPISPARTPTKPLKKTDAPQSSPDNGVLSIPSQSLQKGQSASLNLLNPSPGTPVRFRQPQSSSEADPSYTNHLYRLRQDRSGLKLPDKYEALERMHYSLDHTIMFTTAQNSVCHFHRVKRPVENMSRRTFGLNHLAQIKHIQPDAYSLRPVRVMHEGQRVESLLIGFPDEGDEPTQAASSTPENRLKPKRIVTAAQIEERKQSFRNKLINLVKSNHDSFLKTLNPESNDNDTRVLKQWHPLFNLDSVPDIPEAELPSFPKNIVDAAEYVRSGTIKSRISDTLAKLDKKLGPRKPLASTDVKNVSGPAAIPQDTPKETGTKDAIKSRTSSLLERIRAKQQKKQETAMYEPSPDTVQRNILLSRLPDMVDSIYYLYTSAKRNVMFVREVSRKLSESYKVPLSESEAEEHIVLLAEVAPKWCSIAVADTGSILRIDRTMLLKDVRAMLPETKS